LRLSFAGIDPVEVQAMVAGNAARLYGFDLGALGPVGARIGPTHQEIDRPLAPTEIPPGADRCPAFARAGT
jgi:hypothetical protein